MATRKADMTPAEIAFLEEVGSEIIKALKDAPLEVEGAPMTSVKYEDGSYKQKTLLAGWNFFMGYAYLGARGKLIFGLEPEDARDYTHAEVTVDNMDTIFPLAGAELARRTGLAGEDFKQVFLQVCAKVEERKAEEARRAAESYVDNPTYGMF